MTRLTDLSPDQAKRLAELECPKFATRPWVTGPMLPQRRVAIVSSAGLVVRGENPFRGRDPDYRAIPSTVAARDLLCSHISINFDRTGFHEDFRSTSSKSWKPRGRSARWPRRIIRSWAPLIRCRWSPMPGSWPPG